MSSPCLPADLTGSGLAASAQGGAGLPAWEAFPSSERRSLEDTFLPSFLWEAWEASNASPPNNL